MQNECFYKIYNSSINEKAKNEKSWFKTYNIPFKWRVIILYPLKYVTSRVTMDALE